jgi:hypothetical protein
VRLATAHFIGFKRFTDTLISGIPAAARLVVLAGPTDQESLLFLTASAVGTGTTGALDSVGMSLMGPRSAARNLLAGPHETNVP